MEGPGTAQGHFFNINVSKSYPGSLLKMQTLGHPSSQYLVRCPEVSDLNKFIHTDHTLTNTSGGYVVNSGKNYVVAESEITQIKVAGK